MALPQYVKQFKMSAQIRHKIQELSEDIRDHQFKYYVLDAPTITDAAFDKLWNQLLALESEYPQYKLELSLIHI